jgi:hypothetical protein
VAYLAAADSGRQVILCPESDEGKEFEIFEKTIADFRLDQDKIAMLFVGSSRKGRSPKVHWPGRDREALALAQRIVPVSIRPGGRLDGLLKLNDGSGKIDPRYRIDYAPPLFRPARYNINEISQRYTDWDFITHWTKTRHGPWPGETRSSFYARLLSSGGQYPNSAFNTLKNIVRERKIRASSEKIRDSFHAIGFTECRPDEILGMMRWCPRRVNWNFEPYGVAIKKSAAEKIGARSVTYGTDLDYKGFSESAKPFFQNRGGRDIDWSREREWRHIEDIDLNQLPDDQILFFVWRRTEAESLRPMTPNPVISFEGG